MLKTSDIELIVYDFDGVMTDNRAFILQDGSEAVVINRSDGLATARIRKLGIEQLIMSSEENPIVTIRAKKLKLEVIFSCKDKKKALIEYCQKNKFDLQKTAFVGNDINDVEAMKTAGIAIAPADGYRDVLEIADHVTKAKGGYGVVREVFELLR